jgi:hypothetical protein
VLLKPIEIKNTTEGVLGQPAISTTARMLVKNVGGSAAVNVRALITDFYVQSSSKPLSFVWRDHGEKTLSPSDKDLPGCLEFLTDDGKVYSRFRFDKTRGQLACTNDADILSLFNQFLFPQY